MVVVLLAKRPVELAGMVALGWWSLNKMAKLSAAPRVKSCSASH